MIKCLSLSLGYAESAKLGIVLFDHPQGFKTSVEAIENLSGALFRKFLDDSKPQYNRSKACCASVSNEDNNFCGYCGHKLKNNLVDPESFETYLCQILTSDNDTFGYEDLDIANEQPWENSTCLTQILHYKKKEIFDVSYYAERVLAAYVPQNLLSEESRPLFLDYKTKLFNYYKFSR